jgi:hypothetical protein
LLLQDRAPGWHPRKITLGEAVINMSENYGTIWVCVCCMLTHANGECCADDQHGGDSIEPLSSIEAPYSVTMGMAVEEHSCGRENGEDVDECDCERNTFSTSQCEGCGSYLHGERHAMTLWKG